MYFIIYIIYNSIMISEDEKVCFLGGATETHTKRI